MLQVGRREKETYQSAADIRIQSDVMINLNARIYSVLEAEMQMRELSAWIRIGDRFSWKRSD